MSDRGSDLSLLTEAAEDRAALVDDDSAPLAAVDLGSNSFHMIVARADSGQLLVLDRLREMVRLAAGLDDNDRLTQDKQEQALACLSRFGERLRFFDPDRVRAVGTNTLRKAGNADEFLALAEEALGHPIDVISGREEARLVYSGAVHGAPAADGQRLVIDIGGGSTELILGEEAQPQRLYSLFMGCVSFSKRYFPDGKISKSRLGAARLAVELELRPVIAPLRESGWTQVLGCSGTIRSLAAIARELDPSRPTFSADGIKAIVDDVAARKHMDDVKFAALSERRRPVFLGGLVILERIFSDLGIKSLRVADGALREGLLYDMLGESTGSDARDRTVAALEQRYQADARQADSVEQIAEQLREAVGKEWGLTSKQCCRLLRFAARLHEIGLAIAHSHYHRHGAYIIEHSDLAGFTVQEQAIVAWLVLGHRRRVPQGLPGHLRKTWLQRLPKMLCLLRLATVLARGREGEDLHAVGASASGDRIKLQLGSEWLAEHPLTKADLAGEKNYLAGLGIELRVT